MICVDMELVLYVPKMLFWPNCRMKRKVLYSELLEAFIYEFERNNQSLFPPVNSCHPNVFLSFRQCQWQDSRQVPLARQVQPASSMRMCPLLTISFTYNADRIFTSLPPSSPAFLHLHQPSSIFTSLPPSLLTLLHLHQPSSNVIGLSHA
jgi:hypothetical protein